MKQGLALKEHSTLLNIILRSIDTLALLLSGLFCFWLRFSDLNLDITYKNVLLLEILLGATCLSFTGAYRAWRGSSFSSEVQCVIKAILGSFLLLIMSGFITQSSDNYSRVWVVSWLLTSTFFILGYRFTLRQSLGILRSKGYNIRRVLIIGNEELGQSVANKLIQNPEMGLAVTGFISDNKSSSKSSLIESIPTLGNLEDIDRLVNEMHIDQVWIALPMNEVKKMEKVQSALRNSSIIIRMVPDIFGFQLLNHSITEVAGLPIINLSTSHMIESKYRLLKSLEDKILAFIIIICISPILLGLAIAIKLTSKGPILFKQYRTGVNGRDFKVYKFRSMIVHYESDGEITQATKDDIRITSIGQFMRKTSLDELPQFFNVLQGRMSIVGPRPHALAHNEHYKILVESYMQRHMVKPGITGWAQVNGFRGETDTLDKMEKRIEYDLFYIENWSVWFDLEIIFMTLYKGFIHKNAL
ncbi:undecaprenyl-phosphate glucose phosphotransferase [Marinomonas sp. RSW2]|uniref:Undecaprenyl-phosphate glucose phosphotransferase n=1 Tax=Marinomonas maritima TaxID=2940935 RepID=A0ABT5WH89_9GAMM|nr:undecaprenyl-phosphate glucose phosphotransferase [Marinomonas maritima]MDE8604183.1 undecaprenyl-phosphate glucose phosphotransferase [Marinomonas maritima]